MEPSERSYHKGYLCEISKLWQSQKLFARLKFLKIGQTPRSRSQGKKIRVPMERSYHKEYSCEISKF